MRTEKKIVFVHKMNRKHGEDDAPLECLLGIRAAGESLENVQNKREFFFLMSLHPHRFPRICRTGTSGLCNKPTTVEAINPFWGLLEKNMVTPSISPGLPRACTFNCFQEKKKIEGGSLSFPYTHAKYVRVQKHSSCFALILKQMISRLVLCYSRHLFFVFKRVYPRKLRES